MIKEKVNLAIIGLGQRGTLLLKDSILPQEDVNVVALCDLYEDRCEENAKAVEQTGRPRPQLFRDYHDVMQVPEVDAVIVTSAWEAHIEIACAAMLAGKAVGFEVGGAYSIEDCWKLIRTYEQTGVPCAMLENTCYGRDELLVLNMVRQGLFGEVVHCAGGYRHDLREEVTRGRENRHYRFRNYLSRCGDNYPTHDLGPIANVLNINHGNRMLSLVSMASKSRGLHEFILKDKGPDCDAAQFHFEQGDIVTTMIKCAHGETITLTLDTSLPRPYSRGFHVQGTRAMYEEDNRSIFMDNGEDCKHDFDWSPKWGCVEEYREAYDHPLWKKFLAEGVQGGHDGMDWLEMRAFIDAVKEGRSAPVDVYDAVTWMSITALSEQSIAMGSMPVAIPDFTGGKWLLREPWKP